MQSRRRRPHRLGPNQLLSGGPVNDGVLLYGYNKCESQMTVKAEMIAYYTEWNTFTIWELSCYLYFCYLSFDLIIWWTNGARLTREPNGCYSCWKSNYGMPQTGAHRKIPVITYAKKRSISFTSFYHLQYYPIPWPWAPTDAYSNYTEKQHHGTGNDLHRHQAWPFTSGARFPGLVKAHTSQIPLWWPAQDVQMVEFH